MILGFIILSLSIAVQTTSFQNYLTDRLIEDINEYELNNSEISLSISDASFAINGKMVLKSVNLVDFKSDTIVSLDKVESSFFPLFQREPKIKELIIEGLKIDSNFPNNDYNISDIESSSILDQISNSIGLESLIINNSDINLNLNNQLYRINELNLKFQDISIENNSISLYVDELSGLLNESIQIKDFESDIIFNNQSINILGYKLITQDNLVGGDLKIDLDEDSNINNIEGVLNESRINLNELNDYLDIPESFKTFQTSIDFNGNKEDIRIESFLIDSENLQVIGDGAIVNYNDQNELKINLNIDEFSSSLTDIISVDSPFQFIELINNILFKGVIEFNKSKLSFDLNHNDDLSQSIQFLGDIDFKEKRNFVIEVISEFNENSDIMSKNDLDKFKSNLKINGSITEKINIDRFEGNIKIDDKSVVDFLGNIKNNFISSNFNIINNKTGIDLKLNGDINEGVYKIDSEVSNINYAELINSNTPSIISFNNEINLKVLDSFDIEAYVLFKDIEIDDSNEKIYLKDLSDLNNQIQKGLIQENREYDFKLTFIDNIYEINSFLGDKINLSGNYLNPDKLAFNLKIFDLNLNNFISKKNKQIVHGKSSIDVNIVRDEINRNISVETKTTDVRIKDVYLGELKINLSGNTDYNSYAIDINLSNDKTNLEGSGSIIAINEKPNIDLDLNLNDFNFSFIDNIGKNILSEIDGFASGNINVWGDFDNIQHNGNLILNNSKFSVPYLNVNYTLGNESELNLYNQVLEFEDVNIIDPLYNTKSNVIGKISHSDFKDWELDLNFNSDKLFVLNKEFSSDEYYYGVGFIDGSIDLKGLTKELTIQVEAKTQEGTKINIPRSQNLNIESFSFIEFIDKKTINDLTNLPINESSIINKGLDLSIDLEINNNADIEITIDTENGSYLSGKGLGNLLMEIDTDGKFNIYGDFSTTSGIYNFKNLGVIDKRFNVKSGGTIVWDGDPLQAQMDIEALYEVPGGSNPALLLDNPNFNKKIPTDVQINLKGDLAKPDNPDFEIFFPNTSSTVTSEINYKLIDQEVRQLQAISLLSQGVFINEVSVSIEGLTNNIYEKVSDVFSEILGGNQGPLKVGLNYLQGDKSEILDIKTEDRFGVTLSTKISDKILFNGKIGVPIGGIEETLIIGDVQIEFLLNEDGTLKAKVFNRENEFRYIGDELGYTQGMGISYQVDFESFREIISKLISPQKNN
ncbi:MAG: translocation/assembly module TamB domain-containing protein [Candidatus Marisimplicoccus sp.]